MTFDWNQYLVLAEYLYDNRDTFPDREACLRAAISKVFDLPEVIASLSKYPAKAIEGSRLNWKIYLDGSSLNHNNRARIRTARYN